MTSTGNPYERYEQFERQKPGKSYVFRAYDADLRILGVTDLYDLAGVKERPEKVTQSFVDGISRAAAAYPPLSQERSACERLQIRAQELVNDESLCAEYNAWLDYRAVSEILENAASAAQKNGSRLTRIDEKSFSRALAPYLEGREDAELLLEGYCLKRGILTASQEAKFYPMEEPYDAKPSPPPCEPEPSPSAPSAPSAPSPKPVSGAAQAARKNKLGQPNYIFAVVCLVILGLLCVCCMASTANETGPQNSLVREPLGDDDKTQVGYVEVEGYGLRLPHDRLCEGEFDRIFFGQRMSERADYCIDTSAYRLGDVHLRSCTIEANRIDVRLIKQLNDPNSWTSNYWTFELTDAQVKENRVDCVLVRVAGTDRLSMSTKLVRKNAPTVICAAIIPSADGKEYLWIEAEGDDWGDIYRAFSWVKES